MGKYFGTDGFRGEANVVLKVEHAYKVGRYLGYYFGKDKKAKIVIGKDTRRSSYMFEYALVAGLTASGADAYLLHVTPTPSVSYVVRSERFDCGIMISASHNPFYDNGIKLINGDGYKIAESIENEIEEYIDKEYDELPLATGSNIGRTIDYSIGRNRYIGYLISLATRSFKDKKVGLDLSNGAATTVAKGVFDALGAITYTINSEPNGVNINLECGSTHIEKLQKHVLDNSLDIGFAYDGDADRCLAVDDMGNIIDGDIILYLCGTYMKDNDELEKDTLVATVMSNLGLFKGLEKKGISYEITSVGDRNVFENMMENGYSLGGEQSGHIIFSKHSLTGDGVLTSIKLMEVMLESKTKLSELHKELYLYPQHLVNVRVMDKTKALDDEKVQKSIKHVEGLLGDNGRLVIRQSGTEPVIRVLVEAGTDKICREYVEIITDTIKKSGYYIE
ncbi:MAG TPA: phosphoglucosamine mutase [Clostridiales bacterium]|nr:phosphoglucosamine mutase [Clostridiales bacterium]